MATLLARIVSGWRIADAAAARLLIRRAGWFYVGLTVAMFLFEKALARFVNATDWSPGATFSDSSLILITLAPALGLLATRGRIAAVAMTVLAVAVAFLLGAYSVFVGTVELPGLHRIGFHRLDALLPGSLLSALGWILAAVISFRAFQAASVLRQVRLDSAQAQVQVFD
jgi:hypothetical protein